MTQERDPSAFSDTAIAVVGMAVRVPGAADVQQFWNNLVAGVESITIGDAPDGHVIAAGVLEGVELFDAGFFGCTAGEAAEMDPTHRMFLECAWSALEAAGHAPRGAAMRAGVYGGATYSSYLLSHLVPAAAARGDSVRDGAFGFARDFLAMRVAYKLGLTGPAMTIQTGCSTSLVAIHVACQALIAGECDLALAGGAGLTLPQLAPYRYHEGSIRSADGHCRSYDARGTGTVGGHGVGIVVLRRLADALADGDPVRAVVLGSAVNNDGSAKAGFAAPSVDGQAAAIGEALAMAGVSPADIGYVEGHGTATPLGDPVEVAALRKVFAGVPRASCGLGSVKSNIGHLDAAAGVVGLIKAVLALEHRVMPPTLHFTAPNPQLGLEDSPFHVVSEARAWTGPLPRRAGVSAFGIGGTNAHVVLEEAPARTAEAPRRTDELLVLSARTDAAIERMAVQLADWLRTSDAPLADVAHTLQAGRARFARRRFAAGGDRLALAEALTRGPRDSAHRADDARERDPVFAFPGSGVQRVNMAVELLGEAGFAAAFDECAERARDLIGADLRRMVFAGPDDFDAMARELDGPIASQVAIFAVDWAIARQWMTWGVAPRAVVGHSLGEYVAACVAGVFSLENALRLVVARGTILESLPPSGMVSVLATAEELEPHLNGALSLAAVNGPAACVVSGPSADVDRLVAALARAGIEHRRLRYARASHTPLLDPHLAGFERLVRELSPRAPELPTVSSVTGTWLTAEQATDPAYWRRQFRDTVRFSAALSTLLSSRRRAVIEAGPGGTMSALVRQHPAAAGHAAVATSPIPSAGVPPRRPLEALGEAWLAGVPIDWERFRAGERRRRVALPTYSFDRHRHWIDAPEGTGADRPGPAAARQAPAAPSATPAAPSATPAGTADPARDDTERALLACFRELFRDDSIGIRSDFFALGGDSLLAMRLVALIARRIDVRLALKEIVEAPTVAALAERLGAQASPSPSPSAPPSPATSSSSSSSSSSSPSSSPAARSSCLVRLQSAPGTTPLFMVHGGGGHAMVYRDLARAIDPDRTVYAFESRGLDGREPLHASVEDMARHYADVARALHPDGPYLLAGSSLGGTIAYEMARLLGAAGRSVPLCAMIDAPGPGYLPDPSADDADLLAFFAGRGLVSARALRGRPLDAQLQLLLDEAGRTGSVLAFSDLAGGRLLMRVWKNNFRAMCRYPAPPWPGGEVQFFAASEGHDFLPPHIERAWIGRCAVRVEVSPGDHVSMVVAPNAALLGAKIRGRIEAARTLSPAISHEEHAPMTAPGTSLSALDTIAGHWKELLGVEAVRPTDDFIALGGNSMLAMMLANRIEDDLGVRPEIVELFATLEQVARACQALLDGPTARQEARGGR